MKVVKSLPRSKFWASFMCALLVWLLVTQGLVPTVFQGRATAGEDAASLSAPTDTDWQPESSSAVKTSSKSAAPLELESDQDAPADGGRTIAPLSLSQPSGPNVVSGPLISATMRDSIPNDNKNDGKAEPGDTIRYTVAITNSGTQDATGVNFNDTIDANTTLSGTINVSPLAVNDSFTAVANTRLAVGGATAPAGEPVAQVSGNLLTNDQEFAGDTVSAAVLSAPSSSASGGSVTVNSDGSFLYMPPADTGSLNASDTFTYTLTDSRGLTDTATVTINFSGRVWYVDNAAATNGDGTSASPFNSLTGVNGAGGSGDSDEPNDIIYIHTGGGEYVGTLPLETGQTLIGEGVGLVVNTHTLAAAGTRPTLSSTSGDVLTLAANNTVRGLNIDDSDLYKIRAVVAGTLNIDNVSLSGAGNAVAISENQMAVTFDSLSTTAGDAGAVIDLFKNTGTFTANAGSIVQGDALGTAAVRVNQGTANVTYAGTITNTTGRAVEITNLTGGTVTLSGNINNSVTGTGILVNNNTGGTINFSGASKSIDANANNNAVTLTNNTGHTINFTGGGLDLDTSGGAAFTATGGGTVNVGTGANLNTISITSFGQAVVMNGVTIGSSGITFASISNTERPTPDVLSFTNVGVGTFNGGDVTLAGNSGGGDGSGIDINGSSATFNFSSATIGGSNGAAINLTGANGPVTFTTVNLNGSPTNLNGVGIAISGNTNPVNVNGGTIGATDDPAGNVVDVDGGTANVNIAASLTKSSTNRIVEVTNRTGGVVTFSSSLNCTGTCGGINVASNTGGSTAFSGSPKTLSTGANPAVTLATNTGGTGHTTTFSGGGLGITTAAGRGFHAANGGTINVSGSGNTVNSTAGSAVIITSTSASTVNILFDSVSASPGTAQGINLENITGTFTANGGSITGLAAGGTGLRANNGNANVTYAGAFGSSGTPLAAGRLVEVSSRTGGAVSVTGNMFCNTACTGLLVQNNTGGSTTFSGATKTLTNTGANATDNAVTLSNNGGGSGHTINFTNGGLSITTNGGTGFSATGGGTISVTTGANPNTINSTSGSALHVVSTTISGSDLTFRSISSGAGTNNGITLDNTGLLGTHGGLIVTGNGDTCTIATPTCTGGTIASKDGADDNNSQGIGIYLNNTRDVSLSLMRLNNHDNFAIRGLNVVNFTLANTVIDGANGNSTTAGLGTEDGKESSVSFGGLTGTASVTNSSFSGGARRNFQIVNTTGTLNRAIFTGNTFGHDGNLGTNSLFLEAFDAAVLNASVMTNTFTGSGGNPFQLAINDNSGVSNPSADLVFTNNQVSNSHPNIAPAGGGVLINSGGSANVQAGNLTYNISNNTFRDAKGSALRIDKGGPGAGNFTGTIANNTIGVAGVPDSGSTEGSALLVILTDKGSHNVTITGNTIREFFNYGIRLLGTNHDEGGGGYFTAVVQGNTVANPGAGAAFANAGMHLGFGTLTGDNHKYCLTLGGAGALKNTLTGTGTNGAADLVWFQRFSTIAGVTGYGGAANDATALDTYLESQNTGTASVFRSATGVPPASFSGTCPAASSPNNQLGSNDNNTSTAAAADVKQTAGQTGLVVAAVPGRDTDKASTTTSVVAAGKSEAAKSAQANRVSNKAGVTAPLATAKNATTATTATAPLMSVARYTSRVPGLASPLNVLASPRTAPASAPAAVSSFPVNIGTLPPGEDVIIVFEVTVNDPVAAGVTQVSNQGTVSGTNFSNVVTDDPDTSDANDATVTPLDVAPDLAITKTDGGISIDPGEIITYTLLYTNTGNLGASGVVITETLPISTTFVASASTGTWTNPSGSTYLFDAGTVGVDITGTVKFAVQVDAPWSGPSTTITNTAQIGNAGNLDLEPSDNTSNTEITPIQHVADTPSVTGATTGEDTQTTSGLVITRNAADGAEVTHFKITNILSGTLYHNDGTTQINNGDFITFAEGNAGLKFTPNANATAGSFDAQASLSNSDTGLGGDVVTATITVNPVADTPSVTGATTDEDTQTTTGLVISRHADDGAEVTHFKITNITNGTLYKNDGATAINNNDFITFSEGNAGLKFTPNADLFSPGTTFSFDAQGATSGTGDGLSPVASASITVNPVADTPSVTDATTDEDTQTTSGLVISRNAVDGTEVTHFKITNITGGTLYKNDGTTQINNGDFITFAEGNAGLKFTPASNSTSTGSFDAQGATSNTGNGLSPADTAQITINPLTDAPSVTGATTDEDTQTTSGLVITKNAADGAEVTHFKITNITNGTLFKNDGTTQINEGDVITLAEGNAGLKFTPASNSSTDGSFDAQAATSSAGAGLSPSTTATITVNPVADTPSVTNATTDEDTQTTSGLVISRNAADGTEVTHFKITNITNGTLFKNNGTTQINNGDFITFAEGNAGLRFTPSANSTSTGSFDVQGATSGTGNGLSPAASASITVNPVADTPSVTNATTDEDTQTTSGLVISRNVADGTEVTHFKITDITGGTLYKNDGTTQINNGDFITFAEGNAGLKFTPDADRTAAGSFDAQASLSGSDTGLGGSVATATITINSVNDEPDFTASNPPTVNEDAGPQTVNGWATFDPGPANESSQTVVTYTVSNISNSSLFAAGGEPSVDSSGNLTYAPAADTSGTSTFDVVVQDSGGTANGGVDTSSPAKTFTITVNSVNDKPDFTASNPAAVNEDAGAQTVNGWVTSFDPGPADEAGQTVVSYTVSNISNPSLFASGGEPEVDNSGNLTYTPAADASGTSTFDVVVKDNGGTANGGVDTSDAKTFTITVTGVNDAPDNTVPSSQATNEDTALVFSAGNSNQVSVSDVDAGSSPVRVALTVTHGTLDLASTTGLTFTSGNGSDDASMVFTGTITNINSALNGLSYTPAANYNGPDTLTINTNDQGNTGSGGALSANDTVSISVNAVNDAPQNTVPGTQTMDEGETLVFSQANGNKISIADLDAGSSPVRVALTATNGSLTLASTTGLTFTTGDGTNDSNMVFTGTITNINTALNGMSYTPSTGFSGSGSVTINTNDQGNTGSGGALSDNDAVSVTVNDVATATATAAIATSTATKASTSTSTVVASATGTRTATAIPAGTNTPTSTAIPAGTNTPTNTAIPAGTNTPTSTAIPAGTNTPTATANPAGTNTPTNTAIPAGTNTPTTTAIPAGTNTSTATAIPAGTNTPTATANPAGTNTPTNTAIPAGTNTPTTTAIPAGTNTPTSTAIPAGTNTPTSTAIPAGTNTSTATANPAGTNTPTSTAIPAGTNTSTATAIPAGTNTPTNTAIPAGTSTNTATVNPAATSTSTRTSTATVVPSETSVSVQTATATATPRACEQFSDVDSGDTFYEFINCLACQGVIGGFPDGTFRENASITRGQISKIVSNAAGFNEDPGDQIYSDVPPASPFYAYINRLTNRGIVGGYPCPTRPDGGSDCNPENPSLFKPNEDATRGQMAKIVSNAAGFDEAVSGQFYADVPPQGEGSQFYSWIMRLTNRGVMGGYACGALDPRSGPCDDQNRPFFRPSNTVTRGQATKIVANTFFPNCQAPQDARP